MRKLVLASVFAALPFSAEAADISSDFNFIEDSAPAARSVVGHVEISYGWLRVEVIDGEGKEDLNQFDGNGRVNVPLGASWNLELETGGDAIFNDNFDWSDIGVYAHLWGGAGSIRGGVFGGINFFTFQNIGTIGVEAEVDVAALTLGIQGSYNQTVDCSECDFWRVSGWADLYLTPNTRLGVAGDYWAGSDVGGVPSDDIWSVSASAEHRFSGTPLSIFVQGEYERSFDAFELYSVSGGIRVFMDGGLTLEEHDKQVPFFYQLPESLVMHGS